MCTIAASELLRDSDARVRRRIALVLVDTVPRLDTNSDDAVELLSRLVDVLAVHVSALDDADLNRQVRSVDVAYVVC